MKDLFGKLGTSIKNTCKEAVGQTQKTADQAKYRSEILTLKNDLKKLYQRLGEEQYKHYIEGQEPVHQSALCNRITNLRKEIARLEKEVEEVVNIQKDSFDAYKRDVRSTWNEEGQGVRMKRDDNGIKMMKFCPNCNIGNATEALYCIHCGNKL